MFRRRGGYRPVVETIDDRDNGAQIQSAPMPSKTRRYATEISSSLPLQILIYYNSLLSMTYFFLEGGLALDKLHNYKFKSPLQQITLGPIFVSWVLAELPRIYFGFKGNIKEMVPHMCSFLLMTLFPQMLCIIFLGFLQEIRFPADSILGSIHLIFLALELVLGYGAVKAIINKRTAQFFRVAQEELLFSRRERQRLD